MPWEVVFGETPPQILKNGLPPEDVAAYSIIFGELEGQKFNWDTWRWEKRE